MFFAEIDLSMDTLTLLLYRLAQREANDKRATPAHG